MEEGKKDLKYYYKLLSKGDVLSIANEFKVSRQLVWMVGASKCENDGVRQAIIELAKLRESITRERIERIKEKATKQQQVMSESK